MAETLRRHVVLLAFLVMLFGAARGLAQAPALPLELRRITPGGTDAPASQQIVLEFSRPMVPVGRMERRAEEIPITITPALECAWRWLNTTTLACQLQARHAMTPATRYTVTVMPGLAAQDGTALSQEVVHTFLTQRPKVTQTAFSTWQSPGTPVLLVVFDQPVSGQTVARHIFMQTPSGTRAALSVTPDERYQGRGWLVHPTTELPADTQVQLHVEPGIAALQGTEPGVEQRALVTFATFPAPRFLGVQCLSNTPEEEALVLSTTTPLAAQKKCKPHREAALVFSVPVAPQKLWNLVHIHPALLRQEGADDTETTEEAETTRSFPHQQGHTYQVALPGVLKPYTTYRLQAPARQLKDAFGRLLADPIAMQFATDHRLPDYVLPHPLSILEQQVETHVPLEVVNLQAVHLHYETLTSQGRQAAQKHTIPLKLPQDEGHVIPIKVRELLHTSSGALQGRITTTPRGEAPQHTWFFSQVTPFDVHVKIGHYNTLVWVTRFDTGAPVGEAQVSCAIETYGTFDASPPQLAAAVTDASGIAMLPGTLTLDPRLQHLETWEQKAPRLFLRVRKDHDLAVIPLAPDFAVHAREISGDLRSRHGHIRTWGTTPQGVYKAGDTIAYKFYVRDQDNQRFVPAPSTGYTLQVFDPMDKVVHEVNNLQLSAFGAYHGEFPVPTNGAVGWYRFVLTLRADDRAAEDAPTWEPMRVLVSDFTPAPFRVTTEVDGPLFGPGDTLTVTTQARLHAGGPYGTAATRLTATVRAQPLTPEDPQAAGFTFAVSAAAGTETAAPDATPDNATETNEALDHDEDAESFDYTLRDPVSETLHQSEDVLSDQGNLQTAFELPAAQVVHGRVEVESAVRDDRGKYVAGRATARYVGRDRYVGLRQPTWLLTATQPAQVQVLVVDAHGKAAAGTAIQVQVRQLQFKAAQVKGAGNAYLTRYVRTWREVATCTLVSETTPGACPYTPPTPGLYELSARITDTQGRVHRTRQRTLAVGDGGVLWPMTSDHHLEVVPEKTMYSVGDTARYVVKNPFPGARALITLERFGVQQHWIETFPGSTALIAVPIQPDHLPGFYLSVVVMSPRVEQPLGDNQIDLGKPAFRMGYVQTQVQDPYKELHVTVQPRQAVYKPRQTATVDLQVRTWQGGDIAPVELAVAVLDEAVFDLISAGRDYFDPYKGFYALDDLDLRNYNLLTQLVGRRKFEKKGANPGGDGGPDLDLRSLFKFVSYWNPSLIPDAAGKATIGFELPDNLTGWRVLAMAVTPDDRMGLGEGHFKANKPTEIRPALPNQVIAGDRFEANFTVLNRTDAPRTLDVLLRATGPLTAPVTLHQRLEAEPFKRYLLHLPLETQQDGDLRLRVQAGDALDQDALDIPLAVHKRQAPEVAATYGTTTADEVQETIAFPSDMRPDVGHVSVVATPTVLGGLDGAFAYMRQYPYQCWEQQLTKGLMAAHYQHLKPYLPASLEWPESTDLPQQTLLRAANYQAPGGGMTYYVPEEQYVSPDLSAYTALAFHWLRQSGYTIPPAVEGKLHEYLLTLLRRDVVPDFYSKGMSATVRAMALAALAPHGKVQRDDLQRYYPHVREMSLFGKAHYLLALTQVPDTADLRTDVVTMLQAHADESSGKLVFSETLDVAYKRLLDSSTRSNCVILSALLAHDPPQHGGASPSATPTRLIRTITQARQQRNRWENTQENLFCMQALLDYSRAYERDTPQLTLRAAFDHMPMGESRFESFRDPAVEFQRPIQPADVGRQATVTLRREGQGRVYYATRLFYAPAALKTEPIQAGIEVHREYSVQRGRGWLLLQSPMDVRPGELVRVDLYLSLPAARNFVVLEDPVPGGLEPVNRDLATASQVDTEQATMAYAGGAFWYRHNDWREYGYARWSFYHKELRHQAVRFYSEYLPAGRYHLTYVAQAIAPGEFTVPPAHAEEMYNPETFGQGVPAVLRVRRDARHEAQQ